MKAQAYYISISVLILAAFLVPSMAFGVQGALLTVDVAVDTAVGEATFTFASANMEIYRRELGEEGVATWNLQGAVSPGTSFIDTGLVSGKTYEYRILKDNGRTSFACVTIDAPLADDRGAVLLVVDNTKLPTLENELRQYEMDLSADGWEVVRLDFDRHGTGTPEALKSAIQSAVSGNSDINSVILFGAVPCVWSGYLAPDGHASRPHETDTFYADLDGTWTDSSYNIVDQNIPGDGIYDQNSYPTKLELAVGRVTFHGMGNYRKREVEYLRDYTHKTHAWRNGHRIVPLKGNGESNGYYMWTGNNVFRTMGGIAIDTDYALTADNSYMWIGRNNDTLVTESYRRGIFTYSFKSYKQTFWASNNSIRSMLTQPDWGLTAVWGGRPQWYLHHLSAGKPFGYSGLRTQNNGRNGNEYSPHDYSFMNSYVSNNIQGDPTIRMHQTDPPSNVLISRSGSNASLTWEASSAGDLEGYHVYRSTSRLGQYTRLTGSPQSGLTFTDSSSPAGDVYYQVRAVNVLTLPTGTFYNQSQASFGLVYGDDTCNHPPTATAGSFTVKSNSPYPVTLEGTDSDGDNLTPIVIENPQHGQLRWFYGKPFYVSFGNYTGVDTVTFVMSDGVTVSEPAVIDVTVDVVGETLLAWEFPDGSTADTSSSTYNLSGKIKTSSLACGAGLSTTRAWPDNDHYIVRYAHSTVFDDTQYITWTVEPEAGYSQSLKRVVFSPWATDPIDVNVEMRVSVDSFTTYSLVPLDVYDSFTGEGIGSRRGILNSGDLSGISALQNTTAPVEFRLYFWHGGSSTNLGLGKVTDTGTDYNEDVAVFGTVITTGANTAPTANAQSDSTDEDTPLGITLTGTDPESDPLSFDMGTGPAHGSLSGTAPDLTYAPDTGYTGGDSFEFRVYDGELYSGWATVSITVNAVVANTAPTADAQSDSTDEDTPLGITLTGTDPESDPLTFDMGTGPTHGSLSGTAPDLTYTPDTGYSGGDSFEFRVYDGEFYSGWATVSITVNAVVVNTAPTADAQGVTAFYETPKSIVLTGDDPESDPLTFSIETGPSHGTLTGTIPNLVYTPDIGYTGGDSFTFTVNDGEFDSADAAVTITVQALVDTDSDGMPDDWETDNGFDPADPTDADADADGDGLTNLEEFENGTDPEIKDTDGDGKGDGVEVFFGTDPLVSDNTGDDNKGFGCSYGAGNGAGLFVWLVLVLVGFTVFRRKKSEIPK